MHNYGSVVSGSVVFMQNMVVFMHKVCPQRPIYCYLAALPWYVQWKTWLEFSSKYSRDSYAWNNLCPQPLEGKYICGGYPGSGPSGAVTYGRWQIIHGKEYRLEALRPPLWLVSSLCWLIKLASYSADGLEKQEKQESHANHSLQDLSWI